MQLPGVKKPALLAALLITLISARPADVRAAQVIREVISKYYTVETITLDSGVSIQKNIISGPPKPPAGFERERAAVWLPGPDPALGVKTLTVPAFDWVFGCSAVSAAMIAAYYDRNGCPNMYTGPTNGGLMPLDSSIWGTWTDGTGITYPKNPLIASQNGLDGRAVRGSIDDYWVAYLGGAQDPYITGSWAQHGYADAIGDYMKTSQSAYGNDDGSTSFFSWTSSPDQLTCSDMVANDITVDGTYGRKLFYEARGYAVGDCFNQKTDNNGGGFTFAMFKAEIDALRPVLLNLDGHSIVGVGYDDASSTVYIHDTWDYQTHTMTWGGSYSGMELQSVSIVKLQGAGPTTTIQPVTTSIPTTSTIATTSTSIPTTSTTRPTTTTTSMPTTTSTLPVTTTTAPATDPVAADFTGCVDVAEAPAQVQFYNASTGDIQIWQWSFGDGGSSYMQNPNHIYTTKGKFTVSLTVTGSYSRSDSKMSEDCIRVGDCPLTADFSGDTVSGIAPLTVQFTDMSEGAASQYAWTFGDGGTSTEQNPSHTYEAGGDYSVTLKVTGSGCTDTATQVNYMHVAEYFAFLKKLCGVQASLEGRPSAEKHAAALRNFRDSRLAMSFSGSFLTMLYYINSPELVRIFEANPELKREVGDIVEACAPRIGQGLATGPAAFNTMELARIEQALQALEAQGSPLLKVSIRHVLQQLRRKAFLQQYGIVVLPQ